MQFWTSSILAIFLLVCSRRDVFAKDPPQPYFSLGPQLVEEFKGTYEFKYKRVEIKEISGGYLIRSSGDQSPADDELKVGSAFVEWVLGSSGEKWIHLKTKLETGDEWIYMLRGWKQTYRVAATDQSIVLPAGRFSHCAKVEIGWIAHEHDMNGPQKVVLYLAPTLGIIKREEWSDGEKWHEEVLTNFTRITTDTGSK
jgi:hypothetical protein